MKKNIEKKGLKIMNLGLALVFALGPASKWQTF